MQVVEIFTMNQQIQHVVTLATHLQSSLDPIQCGRLKEFGCLKRSEQISVRWKMVKINSHLIKNWYSVCTVSFVVSDDDA